MTPFSALYLLSMSHQSVFAGEILYAPTIGVVKISTLLLFARIFPSRKFKRMLWAVGLFISTYSAIMVITMIFQCRPIERVWNPVVKAECIDTSKVWILMASMNVLTDFLLLCLPLPQLWKLQMRRGTKLQLIGIFSIGSLSVSPHLLIHDPARANVIRVLTESEYSATVVSIYRIPQLRGLSLYSYDPTWSDVEPSLWSIVEVSACTLGACAITYRPLFNWLFRIQSSQSVPEGKSSQIAATKSSNVNTRTGSGPTFGTTVKMQALNVLHPSALSSIHTSRVVKTDDGFVRIQDSMDV